jgi:hypothetical protein
VTQDSRKDVSSPIIGVGIACIVVQVLLNGTDQIVPATAF